MDAYKGFDPDSYEGRAVASMEGYLEALEGFYVDALSTAGENFQAATGENNNTSQKNEVKMQLRSVNGHDVVWIEENILDENEGLPAHRYIANYIANHIGEVYTIIESGQKVYISKDLPQEYTHSQYSKAISKRSPSTLSAKIQR